MLGSFAREALDQSSVPCRRSSCRLIATLQSLRAAAAAAAANSAAANVVVVVILGFELDLPVM